LLFLTLVCCDSDKRFFVDCVKMHGHEVYMNFANRTARWLLDQFGKDFLQVHAGTADALVPFAFRHATGSNAGAREQLLLQSVLETDDHQCHHALHVAIVDAAFQESAVCRTALALAWQKPEVVTFWRRQSGMCYSFSSIIL
jgi:hypothetical protein